MNFQALLADWPLDPTVLLGVTFAALLYCAGLRYSLARGMARRWRWWHAATFATALLVVVLALDSPLDVWADQLLWAHMVQHELLVIVAAPLLLLSAPAMPLWRGVPLRLRRVTLRWVMRHRWPRRTSQLLSSWLTTPAIAWLLFTVVFAAWHIPALYDLALEQQPIHVLEHLLFLGTALLFWAQVIPSRPLHPRMSYPMRAVYLGAAGLASNVMGAVFVFSTGPMYPFYNALQRAPGALTTVMDQHFAGAAMDVPGTVIFFTAIIALLGFWLQEDERAPEPAPVAVLARR